MASAFIIRGVGMFFPIYYGLDVLGVACLGFSAAYKAFRQGFSLSGAVVLAVIIAISSPLLRDALLSFGTIVPLHDMFYSLAALLGAIISFICYISQLRQPKKVFVTLYFYIDSIGFALATSMGASRAQILGLPVVGCLIIAVLVGLLPGVLRDVCTGDVPEAFEKEFYAVAAVIGAMFAYVVGHMLLAGTLQVLSTSCFIVLLRLIGKKREEAL